MRYSIPALLLLILAFAPKTERVIDVQTFRWYSYGKEYCMDVDIPKTHYHLKKHSSRSLSGLAEVQNFFTEDLADALLDMANEQGFDSVHTLNFVVDFVQYMPYISDSEGDYNQYPIETVVVGGGDCEDTAILLLSLLHEMGYENAFLLNPVGHIAVGLKQSEEEYLFIESTGENFAVGQIPDRYKNENYYAYGHPMSEDSVQFSCMVSK